VRRWLPKIALALVAFLLPLIVLEMMARSRLEELAPIRIRDDVYVNPLPLVTGLDPPKWPDLPEGERLREAKAEGELRVAVFGESSVDGKPLDFWASAPTVLHDLLSTALADRKITVINMGRAGSVSANTYYYLLFTRRFDPDVVIFYMGGNDDEYLGGEQCAVVRHPVSHWAWRALVERSWLLWSIRVLGPVWGVKGPGSGGGGEFHGYDKPCRGFAFGRWTKILAEIAADTASTVVITSHVRNAGLAFEPYKNSRWGERRKMDKETMPEPYRKLVTCRLEPGCDYAAAIVREDAATGETESGMSPLEENRQMISRREAAWQEAARETGAAYIDFLTPLRKISPGGILGTAWFADEIHLTLEGYHFLAQHWFVHLMGAWKPDARPPAPRLPSAEETARYRRETMTGGMEVVMSYLLRGLWLTAIPGLEQATTVCPGGRCDADPTLVLGWMRRQLGVDPGLPPELAPKLETFNAYEWLPRWKRQKKEQDEEDAKKGQEGE